MLTLASIIFAVIALIRQLAVAFSGGRRDYSSQTGNCRQGIVYNFTTAMKPSHKETVGNHPFKFMMGMVMHVATFLALLGIVLLLISPATGVNYFTLLRFVIAAGLPAALYLLIRRLTTPNLRVMSSLEDYLAILATCGLLAVTVVPTITIDNLMIIYIYAIMFFVCLPLGKLRHAVFFFAARADYGRRLGYRNVYPPAAE